MSENENQKKSNDNPLRIVKPIPDEQAKIRGNRWEGTLLPGDPITMFAPDKGILTLKVKPGDQVQREEILGEINRLDLVEARERQKALFEAEIDQMSMSIRSAEDDIHRIEEEIDDRKFELFEAEHAYNQGQTDHDQELIDENALKRKREEFERNRSLLKGAQEMMAVKYKEIAHYEERIQELRTALKDINKDMAIKVLFDGKVSSVSAVSGQVIEREDPIMVIEPSNMLRAKIKNIPFSLDHNRIFFTFGRSSSKNYSGILQIESTESLGADQVVIARIIPDNKLEQPHPKQGAMIFLKNY